ncbi:MAG TPA: acyltransferase [Candidatus Acidoferrales bacterium]|nr:acyltransferase [Candidatus Acidoferrales bacterium]
MIDFLRKTAQWRRARVSHAQATSVGEGTKLVGAIDRRASKARIVIGSNCLIQGDLVAERDESCIDIADNVLLGGGSVIDCALEVKIEGHVLISYACIITDSDNHSIFPEWRVSDLSDWMNGGRHDWSRTVMAPVRICEGAWIGARSIVLKGVTIGTGAVVGMGSVVTRDVPARSVVAGNPARVVRSIGSPPE